MVIVLPTVRNWPSDGVKAVAAEIGCDGLEIEAVKCVTYKRRVQSRQQTQHERDSNTRANVAGEHAGPVPIHRAPMIQHDLTKSMRERLAKSQKHGLTRAEGAAYWPNAARSVQGSRRRLPVVHEGGCT